MGRHIQAIILAPFLFGLMLAASACGLRKNYVVTQLDVRRAGWDTLYVQVQFGERPLFSDIKPAEPERQTVTLFDASFDTLYAGGSLVIPLRDQELGNEERILLEVCGDFPGHLVCEQKTFAASPKRVLASDAIEYPTDSLFAQGRYHFDFEVERMHFGSKGWEPIHRRRPVEGYVLAYVDSLSRAAVKMPFRHNRGRFDLASLDNYRDFRYALHSRLFDGNQAAVHFDVYTDLSPFGKPSLSFEKFVTRKTENERRVEVAKFAEAAGRKIVGILKRFLGGRHAYVYINEWKFDAATRTYSTTMELHWKGAFFNAKWFDIAGRLDVHEDGSGAIFHLLDGNESAEQRWSQHIDGVALSLDSLPAPDLSRAPARRFSNDRPRGQPRHSW